MSEKRKMFALTVITILVSVLYFAFPIDFIPDFVDGIGRADDILMLCIGTIFAFVSLLSGLGNRIQVSSRREEQMRFEEEYRQMYGDYWNV